jgi:hypothetical protein
MRLAIVAAPPLTAFALVAGFFMVEAAGLQPFNAEPSNISEAAAIGAAASALRFIADGSDPNLARPIRAGVLGSQPRTVAAIDAAILGRRLDMIRLLRQHGARVTDAARSQCLAEAIDFRDALPLLDLPPMQGSSPRRELDAALDACLQTSKASSL